MTDIIGNAHDSDINELALAYLERGKNGAAKSKRKKDRPQRRYSELPILELPGNGVEIRECGAKLFDKLALTGEWFLRGGRVVVLMEVDGATTIYDVRADELRSAPEGHFQVFARRMLHGDVVLKEATMSADQAKALLACREATGGLFPLNGLAGCPLLLADGRLIGSGFDAQSGIYVTSNLSVELPELKVARDNILALLTDFNFVDDGDKSRAIAEIITPALRLAGHLRLCPAFVNEADQSQTGKGFFQKVLATIYGETLRLVVQRAGGVGSVDESLATRLAEGRPLIQIDNWRGKVDSPYLEALLTSEQAFPVRVPHKGEIMVDPSHFIILMTSNAAEMTRDLANRSCIVRLRKQPEGFQFKKYPEGDLLDHVRANAGVYLGSILKVVSTWVEMGRPQVEDTPHDFRQWARSLDWIVRTIFKTAPLMQGHEGAKARLSDPSQSFVRSVAAAVIATGGAGREYSAKELYELAEANDIGVPGLRGPDEQQGPRRVGIVLKRVLDGGEFAEVDGFCISVSEREIRRNDGTGYFKMTIYSFTSKQPQLTAVEHTTPMDLLHFHKSSGFNCGLLRESQNDDFSTFSEPEAEVEELPW